GERHNFLPMKTKQSPKKQADLPLPEPMELAKLAAALRPDFEPNFEPKAALRTAMELYVEAVFFLRELPSTSEDDLVMKFGSHERGMALMARPMKQAMERVWEDTLELDPPRDDDDARRFLAEQGLPRKTARSVLNNF